MPTVLSYVLWLMFVSGFESHSLRHIFNDLKWVPVQLQSDYAGLRTFCAKRSCAFRMSSGITSP